MGHIQFLNCLPLYWGLVHSGALLDVELTKDTPDRLGEQLVAGALDIGPVSLVEALRHADELLLLPDLAVGSDGPVQSCVLVSRVPLARAGRRPGRARRDQPDQRPAGPDVARRPCTACGPTTSRCPPDLDAMLREASAAVLIGDAALRATHEAPRDGLAVHDLGAAWRDWTGLPMVFAVWAARRDFAVAHPGLVKDVHRAFLHSRDRALGGSTRWRSRRPGGSRSTRPRCGRTSHARLLAGRAAAGGAAGVRPPGGGLGRGPGGARPVFAAV